MREHGYDTWVVKRERERERERDRDRERERERDKVRDVGRKNE